MKTVRDLEAVRFCGAVYLFTQTPSAWVLERHGGAVSIIYLKLPGENKKKFIKRLKAHEAEIEFSHCMSCTDLCQTATETCRLYEKNKIREGL